MNEPVILMADTLSECSHAPGPWKLDWQPVPGRGVHADFPYLHYVGIQSANYYDVAPNGLSVTGYMRKADALLIASAPELLAALKAMDTAICDGFDTQATRMAGRKALIAARAAIAKAEGRS